MQQKLLFQNSTWMCIQVYKKKVYYVKHGSLLQIVPACNNNKKIGRESIYMKCKL